LFAQQRAAELDRIELRFGGEFIHEAFDGEAVERVAHRPPVTHIDADLVLHIVDVQIRHVIGKVVSRFDREGIDRSLRHRGRRPARRNRWRNQMDLHRIEFAVGIEGAGHAVAGCRSILIVRGIVLARP
jgi:hypothetical protein